MMLLKIITIILKNHISGKFPSSPSKNAKCSEIPVQSNKAQKLCHSISLLPPTLEQ